MTSLFSLLFEANHSYQQAKSVPCWMLEELVESKLDESLTHLGEDESRRARSEIDLVTSHGSVEAFVAASKSGGVVELEGESWPSDNG